VIFTFPNTDQPFTFSPTLDGLVCSVEVRWLAFGRRWYIAVSDPTGNLLVNRALVGSRSPVALTNLTWELGVASADAAEPLGLPVGSVARALVYGCSPGAYNGWYTVRVTGAASFAFDIAQDPGSVVTLGSWAPAVDLVRGYFQTSSLVYWSGRAQFEALP